MIAECIRWAFRVAFYLVLWVLILSFRWDGRTLFDRAHEIIVENPVANLIEEEAISLWDRMSEAARVTYASLQERKRTGSDNPEHAGSEGDAAYLR